MPRARSKKLIFAFATGVALLLASPLALLAADDELRPTLNVGAGNGGGAKDTTGESSGDDKKSFLREYTFENSFDKAGDATQNFEKAIPGKINYNCSQYMSNFEMNGTKYAPSPQVAQECNRRQAEANKFKSEAAGIRKEQRVMAEISRVSDVAAVAAIGAAVYAEVGQKKQDQSSTYAAAARLQEQAAIAAYTTGAADVSMAAWAYAQQKRKLEKMQETLNGKNSGVSGTSGNSALDAKLKQAIEQTKDAAIKHAAYGAGKVAAGYAGMKLAQRTKEQGAAMESLDATKYYLEHLPVPGTAPAVAAVPATGSGGSKAAVFTNGTPNFSVATPDEGKSISTVSATSGGNSSGSSSMPGTGDFKPTKSPTPATSGGGGEGSSMVAVGTGGPEAVAKEAADAAEAANQEAVAKTAFGFGEFSRGGGGMGGGGGGGSKEGDGSEAIPPPPGAAPGALDAGRNIASAINPNQVFDEATAGLQGNEQGSMAGVSGNRDRSLFDTIKLKHTKALQAGNLKGPGAIEVKN